MEHYTVGIKINESTKHHYMTIADLGLLTEKQLEVIKDVITETFSGFETQALNIGKGDMFGPNRDIPAYHVTIVNHLFNRACVNFWGQYDTEDIHFSQSIIRPQFHIVKEDTDFKGEVSSSYLFLKQVDSYESILTINLL